MFNEIDKNRFISTINMEQYPNYYWDNMFEKIAPIEEMYDKDLYNFSKKEIISLYKYFDSKSFDYIRVTNFNFIKYAQWALQETLIVDGQNHFAELTKDEILGCINKFGMEQSIITREELLELLNRIPSSRDKFGLIATFEGLKGKDFCEILEANVADITGNKMKLSTGRIVEVSDNLVLIAGEASKEEKYNSVGGKQYTLYGEYGQIYKQLRDNYTNMLEKGKRFQKVVRNVLDFLGVSRYVTLNSIFTSGLIDCINKFADQDNTTAEEVLNNERYLEYLKNQYGYNNKINNRFILKYKDYLK